MGWIVVAGAAGAAATALAGGQGARKPLPQPGVDPGGVLVAFVGGGIDYTRPGIAARLARDGEGEIIGFDLADRDRRPYCREACATGTDAAQKLLLDAPQSRLAVFKVDGAGLAAPALQMAVQAKADVVVLELPDDPRTAALLRSASERFRDTLIVLAPPARDVAKPASGTGATDATGDATARGGDTTARSGDVTAGSAAAPKAAEAGQPPARPDTVIAAMPGPAESAIERAALIAARAANIVAESPATRGPALKSRAEEAAR